MRPLKIVAIILGIVFALAGLAFVTSGGFALGVYAAQRDSSGFFTSPEQQVGSYGFALTAPNVNGTLGSRWERWVPARGDVTVRVEGRSELPGPLFIGVGPTARVSKYLSGVPYDKISRIDLMGQSVEYAHVDGVKLPSAPDKQSFWVAKKQGTGTQTLDWRLEPGEWTVVIMNGDASAPLAATMKIGAHFGILNTIVIVLTAGGAVLLAIGATLIYVGARRRRPPAFRATDRQETYAEPAYPGGSSPQPAYPESAYPRADQPRVTYAPAPQQPRYSPDATRRPPQRAPGEEPGNPQEPPLWG